jgi:hypothetical protein
VTETTIKAFSKKVRAIVAFGQVTDMTGWRPGQFFQVVIDPNMVSPGGKYIRFDQVFQGGELHGWQHVGSMTVCEVLGDAEPYKSAPEGYTEDADAQVAMKALV